MSGEKEKKMISRAEIDEVILAIAAKSDSADDLLKSWRKLRENIAAEGLPVPGELDLSLLDERVKQKVVVLVKAGSFGLMRPDDYDTQIKGVQEWLENGEKPVKVELIEGTEALQNRLKRGSVDAVVFFTRDMFEYGQRIFKEFRTKVVLLTGLTSGLEIGTGVAVVDKSTLNKQSFLQIVLE